MARLTAVIGTGAWGAATASILAAGGQEVLLVGRDPLKTEAIQRSRRHPHLPDNELCDRLAITADATRLRDADLVLWAVPTQYSAAMARALRPHLAVDAAVVSLSKGLEQGTLRRMSELLRDELGERAYGVLSGPSIADEAIRGLPVGLVMAGPDAIRRLVVERLHAKRFRIYTAPDPLGVELAGALKNVIAIAAGLCDGLALGDNTKAAVITRGLAEMRRLGRAMGALDATFAGLAGMGDLITTCYSPHGRNRRFGYDIARGGEPRAALAAMSGVAEGAWTCRAAVELAARHGVELPIASQVASVIWHATPVPTAMSNLLARAPKEEDA